ncbi:hypothetical protein L9F63_009563, partial [Diploptera punctata]
NSISNLDKFNFAFYETLKKISRLLAVVLRLCCRYGHSVGSGRFMYHVEYQIMALSVYPKSLQYRRHVVVIISCFHDCQFFSLLP